MIRSGRLASLLAIALLLVPALGIAQSQATTGVIEGTVSDPTGAPVPSATVVVKNTATNLERTLATDADGRFRALLLPLGPYRLTVSLAGFATLVREGIVADRRPVGQLRAHAQGLERAGGDRGAGRLARDRDDARGVVHAHQRGGDQGPAEQRPQLPRLHAAHARASASCRARTATSSRSTARRASTTTSPWTAPTSTTRSSASSAAASGRPSPSTSTPCRRWWWWRRAPTPSSAARAAASSTS